MAPGGRGRGGKFSKPTRGGGKKFSKNLRPLDADGNEQGMWGDPRDVKPEIESSEGSSSEESSSAEEGSSAKPDLTREARRAATKAKKEAVLARKQAKATAPGDLPSSSSDEAGEGGSSSDDVAPANPNHTKSARDQASAAPLDPSAAEALLPSKAGSGKTSMSQLSRREREAVQAQQAKERYQKLHAEGKTDEAKADLARLAVIKEKREQEAARKKAEKEEREEADKARKDELDEREKKRRDAAMGGGASKKKVGKK